MSIAPGRQLGPYEIVRPIGAGGMGEVYEANDTRLGRPVAIKVLPQRLANDDSFRERFEREARAVSRLNHPHICTLHDIGEDDGVHFLVMEYIEGKTLATLLEKGPLPLGRALEYGTQIADALDKAHRADIVHRDLKPGNIMLTKSGVKLLDFGLARTREDGAAPTENSEQRTQLKPLTEAGTILGTVPYMAPEQLEGKDVDGRADLFSLGAILFEMVTGRRAFEGTSQASLISALMSTEPPPVSTFQPISPPELDRIVSKSLEKDPDERWHSAYDVATQLAWVQPSGKAEPSDVIGRRFVPWAVAAVAWVALAYFASRPEPVAGDLKPIRFERDLETPFLMWAPGMALSPDGTNFLYLSDLTLDLQMQPFSVLTSYEIAENDSSRNPFFSPDGLWVGYVSGDQLKKVSIEGGPPEVIGELAPGTRLDASRRSFQEWGTWGTNGVILYAAGSGLYSHPTDGETRSAVVELETESGAFLHPQWLPDERHALVTLRRRADSGVHLVDVGTGEMRELIAHASQASYLPSGHLVYRTTHGAGSALYAIRFDLDRLEVDGAPVELPEQVYAFESTGGGFFTVSAEGHLAYLPAGREIATSLTWSDRRGTTTPLDIEPGGFRRPSLSPDGERLAVDNHVGSELEHDLWIFDLETGSRTRFTFSGHNASPVWTPDGTRIAFASSRPEFDAQSILCQPIDGTAPAEPLVTLDFDSYPVSWSSDGRRLAFVVNHPATRDDIWMLAVGATPVSLLATPYREHSPMISPDDRFMAYVSDESGREEVYVIPFPNGGAKHAVSTSGGREPSWSRDGKTLFFRSADGTEMWSAEVELNPIFRSGRPEHLFTHDFFVDSFRQQSYDVAPNGDLLMIEQTGSSTGTRAVIVLNWIEEVKDLLPVE